MMSLKFEGLNDYVHVYDYVLIKGTINYRGLLWFLSSWILGRQFFLFGMFCKLVVKKLIGDGIFNDSKLHKVSQ